MKKPTRKIDPVTNTTATARAFYDRLVARLQPRAEEMRAALIPELDTVLFAAEAIAEVEAYTTKELARIEACGLVIAAALPLEWREVVSGMCQVRRALGGRFPEVRERLFAGSTGDGNFASVLFDDTPARVVLARCVSQAIASGSYEETLADMEALNITPDDTLDAIVAGQSDGIL